MWVQLNFLSILTQFEEVTCTDLLKGKLNVWIQMEEDFLCTGLPVVSELLEILWLYQIVLLLTAMKLCHVTVAETLTLELTKDKMPFDLM